MVRNARPSDVDDLLLLERRFPSDRLSRRSFARACKRDGDVGSFILVATSDGLVVGDAIVHARAGAKVARLHSLVVSHDAEGRGVASLLLSTAIERARARGCTRLRLTVRHADARARKLYERFGCRATRERSGYYGDGETGIEMEASLDDVRRT